MQLTEEDIREFIEIWSDEFKETLPMADARQRATALMELYTLLTSLWSGDD